MEKRIQLTKKIRKSNSISHSLQRLMLIGDELEQIRFFTRFSTDNFLFPTTIGMFNRNIRSSNSATFPLGQIDVDLFNSKVTGIPSSLHPHFSLTLSNVSTSSSRIISESVFFLFSCWKNPLDDKKMFKRNIFFSKPWV